LLGSAAAIAISSAASAADNAQFDIAPQPLASALNEFSLQSHQSVLFTTDLAAAKSSQGVSGQVQVADALSSLLTGTGLTWKKQGDTFLIVSASDPQSGSAAGDGADAGTVQALIVTAQKREENIQDVPIAMSAFTQEDLTKSQVTGGPDLMTQVPNFTFTKTNFSGYSIQIRGIGTQAVSATTDAAVAVAENNTPFIRNRFFEQEFYDLQRVEVLRGPQGTLYGRNATAGVVNIITAKPTFHYEAKLSADVGNYSSSRFEGMINLPLLDDLVALRLAGAWTKRDGYDTNQVTGNQIDGRDLWSTRLSLRFEPTDNLHVNLIWEHFKEDDDRLRSGKQLCHTDEVTNVAGFTTTHYQELAEYGQGGRWAGVQGEFSQGCKAASLYAPESFETPNGLSLPYIGPVALLAAPIVGGGDSFIDPYLSNFQSRNLRVIESTVDPQYKANTDTVELQVAWDLADNLTLTSETGYNSDTLFSMEDYNRFATAPGLFLNSIDGTSHAWERNGVLKDGFFCDPQIGCANRLVVVDASTAKSRQFSQELRVASNFDGPFNFSLGANFLRYDTEDKYYVFINTVTAAAAISEAVDNSRSFRGPLPDWIPNVSDNHECMQYGMRPPNTNGSEGVFGCEYIDPNPIGSLNDMGHNYFLSKNPYKLISYAAFGEAYYNITPQLKLTAGLRWTVDKKEAPRIPSWLLGAETAGYPVAEVVKQTWREPTGRLALDWKPDLSFTDETLVYGSYGRGYKAGGMNPPPAGLVCTSLCEGANGGDFLGAATHPKTFRPEFVNAYELGTKNTLLDGRMTLNGDAFYYDYTGYQISQIVDRSAVNLNFDAKVWGAELEADWRPVENLRLGLKLGFEKTRVADGMRAVDLMDRTAGDPNWVITRPFPTFPSNCVLPAWVYLGNAIGYEPTNPELVDVGGKQGGNPGGCELAYVLSQDPATGHDYVLFPYSNGILSGAQFRSNVNYADWSTNLADYPCWPNDPNTGQPVPITNGMAYPGVDPQCLAALSNNGAGFYKNLSGKELPNAPHMTATLTADYTLPLPNNWLMTLHGDFYQQSEAWARIFNTAGYDKLKAYNNVNLAAIFTNEDAGWKVMAYVKNVFDKANITGAFLNSDDTGLTTNVFLNEPRLYGLRVTKEWTGQGWWTGAGANHTGPYPLTVEISGQVQRQDAPYQAPTASFMSALPPEIQPPQSLFNRDLDWGDGREVKLTYRPSGSQWSVMGDLRYGRTNSSTARLHDEKAGDPVCRFGGKYASLCQIVNQYYGAEYAARFYRTPVEWSDATAKNREEHTVVDFAVGRDVGLGNSFSHSTVSAGIRYADFQSTTNSTLRTLANIDLRPGWFFNKYPETHHVYEQNIDAEREFKGAGPAVSWEASLPLMQTNDAGHVQLDWTVTGGALFGKQKTTQTGTETERFYSGNPLYWPEPQVGPTMAISLPAARSKSVTVPVVDLSLGLSYEIQRIKVGAGYRWERYFNPIDGGYAERKSYDRTIDGPYFKVSVGFGG